MSADFLARRLNFSSSSPSLDPPTIVVVAKAFLLPSPFFLSFAPFFFFRVLYKRRRNGEKRMNSLERPAEISSSSASPSSGLTFFSLCLFPSPSRPFLSAIYLPVPPLQCSERDREREGEKRESSTFIQSLPAFLPAVPAPHFRTASQLASQPVRPLYGVYPPPPMQCTTGITDILTPLTYVHTYVSSGGRLLRRPAAALDRARELGERG